MPSGKTHEKINGVFLRVVIFISLHMVCYLQFGMIGLVSSLFFLGGYLIGTYYLGPDLDIKSRPFYRWRMFRFIWKPYQKMFHHRSFWTHGFVIGDIVRMMYLGVWLLIPYGMLYLFSNAFWQELHRILTDFLFSNLVSIGCFLGGIVVASTLHTIADLWGSSWKKRKRKKRSR